LRQECLCHRRSSIEWVKRKWGALNYPIHWRPFPYFRGKNMNYNTEERNKNENPEEDEDLRRFLRGGFGAK